MLRSQSPMFLSSTRSIPICCSFYNQHHQRIVQILLLLFVLMLFVLTWTIFSFHRSSIQQTEKRSIVQDETRDQSAVDMTIQRLKDMIADENKSLSSSSSSSSVLSTSVLVDLSSPLTRESLGTATWSLLHTLSALYPCHPTEQEKIHARSLINALSVLYPCKSCARHFRAFIASSPPSVDTRHSLSIWMCEAHNSVNHRLNKQMIDCNTIHELYPAKLNDCGCSVQQEEEEEEKKEESGECIVARV